MVLAIAGDVMLGRDVVPYYADVASALDVTRDALGVDAFVANLESPVCHAPLLPGRIFRADPTASADVIRRFDVLSVANNHSLDCGSEGFVQTVDNLKRLGVQPVGFRGPFEAQHAARLEVGGRRFAFIGLLDESLLPQAVGTCIATCDNKELVLREIESARQKSDFVICLLHAGDEMVRFPLAREKALPMFLMSHGVDMVVRSHSHVLQGYEQVGMQYILWGLGDYIFDGATRRRRMAGLVTLSPTALGMEVRPYRVHHDQRCSPRLMKRQPFRYPRLIGRCQRLMRGIDRGVYDFELAEAMLADDGLVRGSRVVVSKFLARMCKRVAAIARDS